MNKLDLGVQDVNATKQVNVTKPMMRNELLSELRHAYENGASIRTLVASTGMSYGSIHSLLRESGAAMRSRGGPNHRTRSRTGIETI